MEQGGSAEGGPLFHSPIFLLSVLGGLEFEGDVEGTPAEGGGQQRYEADGSPPAFVKIAGSDDHQSEDDTQDSVCVSNIASHDLSPIFVSLLMLIHSSWHTKKKFVTCDGNDRSCPGRWALRLRLFLIDGG